MSETILILGGTKEAATLAAKLIEQHPDARVITSLAGRTKEPKSVSGEVRIGGFGGVDGMIDYLKSEGITKLIDATHPFALQISRHAKTAAVRSEVAFEDYRRSPWERHADDIWIEVSNLETARDAIPSEATVLLALGSQHISSFEVRDDVHFVVRMVDEPEALKLKNHSLILGRPSPDASEEARLLMQHNITHIVCRNSGGTGAYAKIAAARKLGIPVIIVQQTIAES